jgi:hypothetical protein
MKRHPMGKGLRGKGKKPKKPEETKDGGKRLNFRRYDDGAGWASEISNAPHL